MNNRRDWLKQAGLLAAALSIDPFATHAGPPKRVYKQTDDGWIHLNANENPYGPSPVARKLMEDVVANSNRYQWDLITDLVAAIAYKNKLTPQNILVRAGSIEVLDLAINFFAKQKGSFVVADPTFAPWSNMAGHLDLKKIAVPLNEAKNYDLDAMLSAIRPDTRFVHICNPNNPTGTVCDHQQLSGFIKEATKKTWVLLDEAYIDYSGEDSMMDMVDDNEKLIITRTFSKIYSMAGARVGYAMAHPATIEKLTALSTWTNGSISASSLAGAIASLKDVEFTHNSFAWNAKAREYTSEALKKKYIPCIPSHTNFIYFSLADYQNDFFARLKDNKIMGTRLYEERGKWSRITVGTVEEMEQFIKAIG
ncbi:MAG TPA: aminotransferase class I/II-fold pyridoxal phosphate-dependent enzyme [Ferruginibacter sp.]|nr:aminotransferase class I/II-fold pyridoxal phosphate-dependent enzyme [Ferruginibacter sp.]